MIRSLINTMVVLVAYGSSVAFAQGSYLEREEPSELVLRAYAVSCPVSDAQVLDVAQGVLIRSRIQPLSSPPGAFRLLVLVNCSDSLFRSDVDFREYVGEQSVRYGDGYGRFGTFNTSDYLLDSLKESVEAAMTDYVATNFGIESEASR